MESDENEAQGFHEVPNRRKQWHQFPKKNNAQGNGPFARQEYGKKSESNIVTTGVQKCNVENTNMIEDLINTNPNSYDDDPPFLFHKIKMIKLLMVLPMV